MRFNSVQNSDYSQAARAVTQNMDSIYDTSRQTAPDFNKIAETALKARSNERQAAAKAEGQVARQGIKSSTDVALVKLEEKTKKDVKNIMRPAKRMAGVVAGLGALTGAWMTKKDMAADAAQAAELKALREKNSKLASDMQKSNQEWQKKIEDLVSGNITKLDDEINSRNPGDSNDTPGNSGSTQLDDTSSTGSTGSTGGGSGKKVATASPQISPPETAVGLTMSTLTGDQEKVASRVRAVESGEWGYDAFNQFGDKGGHSNRGTGGAYGKKFGTPLTEMTLAQVMEKQKDHNNRSVSDAQWQQQGGIWAAGAYQFIPTTLADVVRKGGFDTSRKFDAKLQDELFAFHVRDVRSLQPWVGIRGASDYNSLNTLAQTAFS